MIDSFELTSHSSVMYEWFVFLRGLALGLILALVFASVILYRQYYVVKAMAAFSLSICGYLLAPLLYGKTDFFYLVSGVADTVPLMFLLFTQALFAEHTRPARNSLLAGALYLSAGYAESYLPLVSSLSEESLWPVWLFSRVVMVCMLSYSLFITMRQWREDLVQPRRLLRLVVTIVVCTYILVVVVVESVLGSGTVPLWVEVANSVGIVTSCLIFTSGLFYLGPGELSAEVIPVSVPQALPVVDQRELDRIVAAMEQERVYKDMELTIRSLGAALTIPEHRLRQHINQQLDYRNFNDFLNHYRIEEASAQLRDSENARLPVLTIAMDAGYRSMTTFNKAFRARHGLTPMEYRQKHQSIS
ncbi:MAG: helix-turn-helix domain-containing protein [Halioglobus sp.]